MNEVTTPKISERMDTFIGTKIVKGFTMSKAEYCAYRGWDVPEDEDPNEMGYLVEYPTDPESKINHPDHEGYITMSPKHVFDKAYRTFDNLTFGMAIMLLKQGHKLARKGWNGADMFCYYVGGSTFEANREPLTTLLGEGVEVSYRPHIDLKTADGSIATWSPSGSDALAEDWCVVD